MQADSGNESMLSKKEVSLILIIFVFAFMIAFAAYLLCNNKRRTRITPMLTIVTDNSEPKLRSSSASKDANPYLSSQSSSYSGTDGNEQANTERGLVNNIIVTGV